MIRLTAKNVIALHKQMIEKTGGSYGGICAGKSLYDV